MDETRGPLHQHKMSLEIDGKRFNQDAPGLSDAIADAYWRQCRPKCMCQPEGVEMYVARLGNGYIVKRMPDTGSEHDPRCTSFEPAAEASGLGALIGSAIIEDPSTGTTTLKLDFALSIQAGRNVPVQQGSPTGTIRSRGTRLSLRSLLHLLWCQAELNRWHPGFAGKRNWAVVRRQLLRAAAEKIACGATLDSRLYVPETFSVEHKDYIEARRRRLWGSARLHRGRPQQLLLMIAEVKSIAPGRHGFKAVMKHIPSVAFAMDEALYRRVETRFADELALWNASDGMRLIMISAFRLNEAELPEICGLYLMAVTRHWLPVESEADRYLVDSLVENQRAFQKLLRYDLRRDAPLATVALTDRGSPPPLLFAGEQKNEDCVATCIEPATDH